jgi:hypothetical protein
MINLVVLYISYKAKRQVVAALFTTIIIAAVLGYFLHLRTGGLFAYLQSEQQYFLLSGPDPDYTFHTLDGTPGDLVMKLPYAINNILLRPNFIHSSSLFRIYQSIELLLIWLTIGWMFIKNRSRMHDFIFSVIILFFLLELLLVFGVMVTDADTLCRYRSVPIMFLLLLTLLRTRSDKPSAI